MNRDPMQNSQDSTPSATGSSTLLIILGAVAAAIIGLIVAWQRGWFAGDDDDGQKWTAPQPLQSRADERLLRRLMELGSDSEAKAEEELRRVRGAGWRSRAGELLAQLDGQALIEPLNQMPEELRQKGILRGELGLARKRPAGEALQLRRYLHEWRAQLKDLRAAGQVGLRVIDAQKLGDFPTLALIKALTDDIYRSLDSEPPIPQLPWFSRQDEDTAQLLQDLLRSENGKRFLAQRAGAATQEPLTKVIPLLHQTKVTEEIIGKIDGEISASEAIGAKPSTLDETVSRAITKLIKFLREEKSRESADGIGSSAGHNTGRLNREALDSTFVEQERGHGVPVVQFSLKPTRDKGVLSH